MSQEVAMLDVALLLGNSEQKERPCSKVRIWQGANVTKILLYTDWLIGSLKGEVHLNFYLCFSYIKGDNLVDQLGMVWGTSCTF